MAKKKRSRKEQTCREAMCPMLSGRGGAGALSGCECGQNAELKAVLASTLDPVVAIDSFGTIRTASNSVERVFGWTPAELVGCFVQKSAQPQ